FELLVGVGLHRRVGCHFSRVRGVALSLAVVLIQRSQGRELGMLARELLELLHVARGVLGGEQAVQIVEPPDHAVELGAQRGFHLMRKRRARVAASARRSSPAVSLSAWVGACSSLLVRPCDKASRTRAGPSPPWRARSAGARSCRRGGPPRSGTARIS